MCAGDIHTLYTWAGVVGGATVAERAWTVSMKLSTKDVHTYTLQWLVGYFFIALCVVADVHSTCLKLVLQKSEEEEAIVCDRVDGQCLSLLSPHCLQST